MAKFKVTQADGIVFAGQIVPAGTVLEVEKGPHTDAWLRFKQAEEVKDKAPKEAKEAKEAK